MIVAGEAHHIIPRGNNRQVFFFGNAAAIYSRRPSSAPQVVSVSVHQIDPGTHNLSGPLTNTATASFAPPSTPRSGR